MALAQGHPVGQLLDIAFLAIPCQEAMALALGHPVGHPGGVRIVARCKKNMAGGPRPAPATRRTIAHLHFSFVHHVECAMRTIKIIASEHRHSIIGVMTQTYP